MAQGHDIIVVGASMGGLEALRTLAGGLPDALPAAVFVVLHTSPRSPGMLGQILDRAGALPARLAQDGEAIERGRLYVAPPDHHLLVKPDVVRLTRGPRENGSRPAIDPLFRSAAVAYRSRVVGVVLSGTLDDGAAGLRAVACCGGRTVVQDPADALYAEMPQYALEAVSVDHCAPVAEIGSLLGSLSRELAGEASPVPQDLLIEAQLTERVMDDTSKMDKIGKRTSLSCPACGGALWKMPDPALGRYRCHIGHAFTEASLLDGQTEAIEQALVVALRTMEDRIKVLERVAREDRKAGWLDGTGYEERAAELKRHVQQIRELLLGRQPADVPHAPSL